MDGVASEFCFSQTQLGTPVGTSEYRVGKNSVSDELRVGSLLTAPGRAGSKADQDHLSTRDRLCCSLR